MTGYFDQSQITLYLNLCHLIKEESKKIYDDPRTADINACVSIASGEATGIGRFLIDKGLMTTEEYTLAIIDGLQVKLEALQKITREHDQRKRGLFGIFRS